MVTDSSVDRVRKNLQKKKSRLVSTKSDKDEDEGDKYGERLSSEGRKRKKRKASKKMPSKEERKREKRKEREGEEEERNLRRKLAIVQGVEKSKSSRAKVGSGSGSRKRKRLDLESSSDSETTLKTQVRRLTEKLKDMETSRKWNLKSNEMQYLHQVKVRQLCVEDFRDALVKEFASK